MSFLIELQGAVQFVRYIAEMTDRNGAVSYFYVADRLFSCSDGIEPVGVMVGAVVKVCFVWSDVLAGKIFG